MRSAGSVGGGSFSKPSIIGASLSRPGGGGCSSVSHSALSSGRAWLATLPSACRAASRSATRCPFLSSHARGSGAQPPPSNGTSPSPSDHARMTAAASTVCGSPLPPSTWNSSVKRTSGMPDAATAESTLSRGRSFTSGLTRPAASPVRSPRQRRSLSAQRTISWPCTVSRRPGTRFSSSRSWWMSRCSAASSRRGTAPRRYTIRPLSIRTAGGAP